MTLEAAAAAEQLAILGIAPALPGDGLPDWVRSIALLGPAEPGFWPHLTDQPEWHDGAPDPIDRWSRRVITAVAGAVDGLALFPFGGPPHHPFYSWALRSGRAFASPVAFLVHDRAGLFVSFRGAIGLAAAAPPPPAIASPCDDCRDRPCLTACPARALTAAGYDVPACHAFLDSPAGIGCLGSGCAVRRACPISAGYARVPAQSAYHMRQFHR